jgi:hypothetical protein
MRKQKKPHSFPEEMSEAIEVLPAWTLPNQWRILYPQEPLHFPPLV